MRIADLTVGRVDKLISDLRRRKGFRDGQSGPGDPERHLRDARPPRRDPTNPVRDVARLKQGRKSAPRALTVAEAGRLLAMLDADAFANRRDLPDLVRFLLVTGNKG